jgi:hypothetical protein
MRAYVALSCAVATWLTCAARPGAVLAGTSRYAPTASDTAAAAPLDTYALDATSRAIPAKGAFTCPQADLVDYAGTSIKLHKKVRLHRAFVPRVALLERVIIDVATAVYGRAPSKLVHMGGYVCRRMKTYPQLLSEHALGNALDISSFEFSKATTATKGAAPKGLAGAFTVSVDKHWSATRGTGAVHARFLRALADALIARADLFRVMLGPSWPGHGDHFHVDNSTYRLISF